MPTRKSNAIRFLEQLTGGPVTLGRFVEAVRLGEELTQAAFAEKLGLSRSHLNDIEKGRKAVAPERAARFATVLGYSQARFVQLALQDLINRGGLELEVDVKVARRVNARASAAGDLRKGTLPRSDHRRASARVAAAASR